MKRCAFEKGANKKEKGCKMKVNKIVINVLKNIIHLIASITILMLIIQLNKNENNEKFAIQEITTKEKQEVMVAENTNTVEKREDTKIEVTSRHSFTRDRKIEELVQMEEIEETEEIIEEQYTKIEDINISKDMDLTITTGISKEDFKMLMSNVKYDTSKFFYDNSDYIYDLCHEYKINEIFFCGLISAESGWNIASNHRRTHNYISLMTKSGLIQYNSVEEGLVAAAKALHNNYLTEGGRFYNGKTLYGVKTRFCPASSTWVELVYGRMQQIMKSI